MAKLTANVMMMGVSKNTGKDGTVYATAQLFFTDDKTMLPVGIDRKNVALAGELEKMDMVAGQASIAIREYKGSKFLDLVGFERKK